MDMRYFGPRYPPAIQRHVIHAEKLVRVLACIETGADPWSIGRGEELGVFLADVLCDLKLERLAACDAAAALERHLASLHAGLRARTGATPSCCRDAVTLDAPRMMRAKPTP